MAENIDTLKGSTMEVFGSVRQNILDRNSWYSPFLSIDFFATGKILKHSTEGLLNEMFRHCETKKISRKVLTAPTFSSILFRYPKMREDWRVRLRLFWHCETEIFRKKTWYFPLLLNQKLLHPRNFLKHSIEGFLYEMVLYCEKKSFRRKIVT